MASLTSPAILLPEPGTLLKGLVRLGRTDAVEIAGAQTLLALRATAAAVAATAAVVPAGVVVPTIEMITPADDLTWPVGVPMPVAFLVNDPSGVVTKVELVSAGVAGAVLPVFNPSSGHYERDITYGSAATRTLAGRLTYAGGTIDTPAVDVTAIAAEVLVTNFVSVVNPKRVAASAIELRPQEIAEYHRMVARFGNLQGELSQDWRPRLIEAAVLHSYHNVNVGTEIVGLRGNVGAFEGDTLPTWSASGVVNVNGRIRFATDVLAGHDDLGFIVVAQATGPTSVQHLLSAGGTSEGRVTLSRGASTADNLALSRTYTGGSFSWGTGSGALLTRQMVAAGQLGSTIYGRVLPGGSVTSNQPASGQRAAMDAAVVPAGDLILLATDVNGYATPFVGTLSMLFIFDEWNEADYLALATIIRETVGAGLSLP